MTTTAACTAVRARAVTYCAASTALFTLATFLPKSSETWRNAIYCINIKEEYSVRPAAVCKEKSVTSSFRAQAKKNEKRRRTVVRLFHFLLLLWIALDVRCEAFITFPPFFKIQTDTHAHTYVSSSYIQSRRSESGTMEFHVVLGPPSDAAAARQEDLPPPIFFFSDIFFFILQIERILDALDEIGWVGVCV